MKVGVIIPLKELGESKRRLSEVLDPQEREELTQIMFLEVLRRVNQSPLVTEIVVVTPDKHLSALASSQGANSILEPLSKGVNSAVLAGTHFCSTRAHDATIVIPADIPILDPRDLDELIALGERDDVVITPSMAEDGTNALVRRPPDVMPTFYDMDSFRAHLREADSRRLKKTVFRAESIMFDIDTPEDVLKLSQMGAGPVSKFLSSCKIEERVGMKKVSP